MTWIPFLEVVPRTSLESLALLQNQFIWFPSTRRRYHLQNGSWSEPLKPTGAGTERSAIHTQQFGYNHCSAVVSSLSQFIMIAPCYKCFVFSKGPHHLIWPVSIRVLQQQKLAPAWNRSHQKWPQRKNLYPLQTTLQALDCSCNPCPPWLTQSCLPGQCVVARTTEHEQGLWGEQRCSRSLGSGIFPPSPDAFRGLNFSQSDIGTI